MGDWLSPENWLKVPFEDEMTAPVALTFVVICALGFLVTLVLLNWPPARLKAQAFKRRYLNLYLGWLVWAFGFGIVVYLFQLMGLPFLGWRIWTWIALLLIVALLAYSAFHWQVRAQPQIAAHEAQQAKRYYQQQARKRLGPDGAPVPRSQRAEKRRQRTTNSASKGR